ncbi:MAG TPA: PQQ-dependent sugar dehydrogenase, partial [Xanthomonadales bacterium]|nr:PQQ-dependent sugar dehydrogenase [Xanthomonadales bacterium]
MHPSAVAIAIAAFPSIAAPQILPTGYVVETLAPGQTGPIGLDFLPDGRVIFVEQDTGAVKVLALAASNAVATLGAVPGLRVSYSQGLLGVAVDPQWPARPFVYCYHTNLAASDLRLTRFEVAGDLTNASSTNLQLGQAYVVLDGLPDATPMHEAGCLRFGPDGMLYCTVGDDSDACAAQDVAEGKGKLLRLRVDT